MAFFMLSEMVSKRMCAKCVAPGCLSIYLRDKDLKHITRQRHLYEPTFISDEIIEICMELYSDNWDIRLRP